MNNLSPLAQYDFKAVDTDKKTNTVTLKDQSGNNSDGTVHSGCSIVNDPIMGNCMLFDGTSSALVGLPPIDRPSGADFSNGITLTMWMSPASNDYSMPYLIDGAIGSVNYSLQLGQEGKEDGFFYSYATKNGIDGITHHAPTNVKAGEWNHLAMTVSAKGKVRLYKNGQEIGSAKKLHKISSTPFSGSIGGVPDAPSLANYNGKMAWLSVYDGALSQEEINQDMIQGEGNRTVSFRRSYPVDFQVYSINNNDQVQALYIDNTGVSQDLYLEVTNNTTAPFDINSGDNIFSLDFRPGTLSSHFLQSSPVVTVEPSEQSGQSSPWTVQISKDADSGIETIGFTLDLDTGETCSIEAGKSLTFTLPGASANRVGGTRNTNVEFSYDLGTHKSGQLLQSLSVVSHLGQKNIPLHVDIIGAPNVLNDGSTPNELLFRIQNVGDKAIPLSTTSANGITAFDINILTEPADELVEWALVKQTDANSLSLQWPLIGVVNAATTSATVTLTHKVPQQIDSGTTVIFKPPTGEAITGKLSADTTNNTLTLSSAPSTAIPKGSVVTAVSGIGQVGVDTTAAPSDIITFTDDLSQRIPKGTSIVWTNSSNQVETATLVVNGATQQKELKVGRKVGLVANTDIYVLSPPNDWKIEQTTSTPGLVQWSVTNQSIAALEKGASLEFLLQGIVCDLPSGQSPITIAYSNIPGYWPGQFVLPVTKSPIVAAAQHVGIGVGSGSEATLNVAYPEAGMGGKEALLISPRNAKSSDTAKAIQVTDHSGNPTLHIDQSGNVNASGLLTADGVNAGAGEIQTTAQVSAGSIDAGAGEIQTTGEVSAGSIDAGAGEIQTTGEVSAGIVSTGTLHVTGGVGLIVDSTLPNEGGFSLAVNTNKHALGEVDLYNTYRYAKYGLSNAFMFHQMESDNSATFLMAIGQTGYVGIGVQQPDYPLDVQSSVAHNFVNRTSAFAAGGQTGTPSANDVYNISIHASHGMISNRYFAPSDSRIKEDFAPADSQADLETLMRLEVSNFRYTDHIELGKRTNKGVIAQELEKILPEAVIKHKSFVPNVYAYSEKVKRKKGKKELIIFLPKKHGIQPGDVLQVITDQNKTLEKEVVAAPDPKTIVLKDWTEKTDQVFVHGKKVDDLRAVDYNQISMLGVSATQQLHKELEAVKKENKKLKKQFKKELGSLKAELEAIKNLLSSAQ